MIASEAVDTVLLPIAQRLGRLADNPASIRDAYEQRLAGYRQQVVGLEDSLQQVNQELEAVRAEFEQFRALAPAPEQVAAITIADCISTPAFEAQPVAHTPCLPVTAPCPVPASHTTIAAPTTTETEVAKAAKPASRAPEPSYQPAAASRLSVYDEPSPEGRGASASTPARHRVEHPECPRETWSAWHQAWGDSSLRRATLELSEIRCLGWLPAMMIRVERLVGLRRVRRTRQTSVTNISPSWLVRLFHMAVPAGAAAAVVACGSMLVQHHANSSSWQELDSTIASAQTAQVEQAPAARP